MTLGPKSILETGTSVVWLKKETQNKNIHTQNLFWRKNEAGSYIFMISLGLLWTPLLVMNHIQGRHAVGFLFWNLSLEVFTGNKVCLITSDKQICNRFHGTHFSPGHFTVFWAVAGEDLYYMVKIFIHSEIFLCLGCNFDSHCCLLTE